jgi:predicted DNA-binding transcriptional regulator YafY
MWEADLKDAIKRKAVVTFRYKNEVRRVEPHLFGYHPDNELHLSAWQTSGTRPAWRDFHVGKLSDSAIATTPLFGALLRVSRASPVACFVRRSTATSSIAAL